MHVAPICHVRFTLRKQNRKIVFVATNTKRKTIKFSCFTGQLRSCRLEVKQRKTKQKNNRFSKTSAASSNPRNICPWQLKLKQNSDRVASARRNGLPVLTQKHICSKLCTETRIFHRHLCFVPDLLPCQHQRCITFCSDCQLRRDGTSESLIPATPDMRNAAVQSPNISAIKLEEN